MGFNIKSVLNLLNGISSPNQAIDMMLSKLPPQTANMLRSMMGNGVDPKQAIINSARNGQISLEQLNQAIQLYSTVRKFGFRKFNVPDSVWNEAENLIKKGSNTSGINGYTRF